VVVLYILYKLYKRRAARSEIVRTTIVSGDETAPDAVIPAPAPPDAVLTGENTGTRA